MKDPAFSLLPLSVRPSCYEITLWPDLASFAFAGHEQIDVAVATPTSRIVLNASELVVQSVTVHSTENTLGPRPTIVLDPSTETLTLAFDPPLPAGKWTLELEFTGTLNDRLCGFYRSRYVGLDGKEHFLATTQFEPTDARRAFPCWDEPSFKASFRLSLVIPDTLMAISNTLITHERREASGFKRVVFAETPPMSTYLLAFLVGEFDWIQETAPNGTLVRVFTTPGKAEQGQFALRTAVNLLAYFNEYFGIPYPLPKLDHIAAPDFAAGAMENWGAITYRETALLIDPENSSSGNLQRVAEIIAHEMAHMWFGDLVTMAWWNDLWLNESFASWMGTKAVDFLFPEWDMWTQFLMDDLIPGLSLDGLVNSHPIEQPVRDPSEVSQLFDAISYSKGASILRMLEHFLGEDVFRAGLRDYLSAHQYGNARGSDLWEALQVASGQPVPSLMAGWILQTGYPVIDSFFEESAGISSLRLSQRRFLYNPTSVPSQAEGLWQVPISITAAGSSATPHLLLAKQTDLFGLDKNFSSKPPRAWVKINAGQTGFFRVNYSPEEWARFLQPIASQDLPAADRLGLENDAFALCRAGLIPATQFLSLARAFVGETAYPIWGDLSANLRLLDNLLCHEDFLPSFRLFARKLLTPVAQRVGWIGAGAESHLDVLLRSTVIGTLGFFSDVDVLASAQARFSAYLEDSSSLSPDLRSIVYSLAAQSGDASTHQALRSLASQTSLQEERVRLHLALGRFLQGDLLQQTLSLSLSPEVRSQDTISLISSVAGTAHGLPLAWQFIKENWPELDRRYGSGGFGIMRLVSLVGGFATNKDRDDVALFFRHHPVPAASRTIQQALERISLNAQWLDRNRAGLASWLRTTPLP